MTRAVEFAPHSASTESNRALGLTAVTGPFGDTDPARILDNLASGGADSSHAGGDPDLARHPWNGCTGPRAWPLPGR